MKIGLRKVTVVKTDLIQSAVKIIIWIAVHVNPTSYTVVAAVRKITAAAAVGSQRIVMTIYVEVHVSRTAHHTSYEVPLIIVYSYGADFRPTERSSSNSAVAVINVYNAIGIGLEYDAGIVVRHVETVINELSKLKNTKEDYLKIRKQKFTNDYKRAAKFIYLNHTSFNGIYRVNSDGEYNVPYGYRNNLKFDYENLRLVSNLLKKSRIKHGDFSETLRNVKAGDLVFVDPPYTVTHNHNGFVKYNQKIFSIEDQYRLANTVNTIKEIGAYYILTNAAHHKVREIFNNNDSVIEVKRASLIGGKNAARGQYEELIITNVRA